MGQRCFSGGRSEGSTVTDRDARRRIPCGRPNHRHEHLVRPAGSRSGALGTRRWRGWPLARLMERSGRRRGAGARLRTGPSWRASSSEWSREVTIGQLPASARRGMAALRSSGRLEIAEPLRRREVRFPAAPRGRRAMGLMFWGRARSSISGETWMEPALSVGARVGLSSTASGFP